jgi:hypothetical protein
VEEVHRHDPHVGGQLGDCEAGDRGVTSWLTVVGGGEGVAAGAAGDEDRLPSPEDELAYNMYYTPDGRYAIVVAELLHRLDFRNPHTFALHRSLKVPCAGVDHMDFSADGTYLIASCEFSGQLVKV